MTKPSRSVSLRRFAVSANTVSPNHTPPRSPCWCTSRPGSSAIIPAAFLCALLNSQPMGFYSPSQLLQDARRHGVDVRPVTVNDSTWEARLESAGGEAGTVAGRPAVRLGLGSISGLPQAAAARLLEARRQQPLRSVAELATRAQLTDKDLALLAAAGALASLAGHRRQAAWLAAGAKLQRDLLGSVPPPEEAAELATPSEAEELIADYAATGFTPRSPPP
jgi:error-prone DNA polymerase